MTNKEAIETYIRDFFTKLYVETMVQRPVMIGLNLKKLELALSKTIESEFLKAKVWQARVDLSVKNPGTSGVPY